ncbi:TldD/PmbA family protein [uncultured Methanobrevibacter sp.]|uniref:TldD/PmbA family protein n=1 Tax=uncultured Methanobrevibacter sp. TaxID=253161 RepID=UPI0025DF8ADF|nr:TldD/PmbA family protein [uncultured Methanobrevibacter sp.]MEE1133172.1 TldD/PmbA family protein [Methanobrevibacter sp.]MEE3490591.1 TldD/PmbA family protein [Methanobrevibacter sp.]
MEEYINLFENVIAKTSPKVDYVDIRCGMGDNTSILMKDGNVDEINTGMSLGTRIRVLNNGAWGFAYTTDISKIDEITETALKLSNSLKGDVTLSESDIIKDKVEVDVKIPFKDISIEEKSEIMKEANDAATIDKVNSTTVSYADSEVKELFMNSEGSEIQVKTSRLRMALNASATNGEIIQFGHGSLGGVKGYEIIKDADIEEFGRKIGEKAVRLLDAKPAPSGQFPVVADSELTGVLIHEALGHATEGDLILQNDSILKDKLGEQIASDIVNIFDDASRKDGFGYFPYDVEGIKTKPNQLVKDGKLISLLNSRETSSKLGMSSSGNARSLIADQPIVRMSNTYLQPGDMEVDELFEDIEHGMYLKGSRGGQVDTGKGIFQFNAAEGYLIENGEITTPLRDVSLSGNILETLKNIDAIGNDFKLSVGFCGKDGQTVPVGDGGPHTRILNALVGGMG